MVESRMRLDDVESCADAPSSPSRQVAELGKMGARFHNISLRPGFKQPSGIHLRHPIEAKAQECRPCVRLDCDVHHHISLSSVSVAYSSVSMATSDASPTGWVSPRRLLLERCVERICHRAMKGLRRRSIDWR